MSTIVDQLKRHEGFRSHVYKCTAGKDTIGYGFNLETGITERQAELLLRDQLLVIHLDCCKEFIWYKALPAARQGVIMNMVYNLGMAGFKKFKRMRAAIIAEEHDTVVNEMLASKWAHQVKSRAWELCAQWRDNKYK